ncbi:MAG: SHOCT domain-containing protein [Candidatus Binatia bacterium]|nr:SHOCT domain-containing protein [Candidatus Binatia bacterium]
MMGFGGIFGILLIGLIVWAVIQFTNNNSSSNPVTPNRQVQSADKDNALEILKKRYARGEINQEEYERMKDSMK